MTWIRRLLACLLLAALAGCSKPTPFCDYAAGLVKQSQLTGAASAYAEAKRRKEGSCADDGLGKVVKLQGNGRKAYQEGLAAARAGDLPAARASLRAALRTDQGDVDAAAQLQRLGQPAPVRAVPATVVISTTVSGQPGTGLAWSALATALTVFALVVAAWLRRKRSLAAAAADVAQGFQESLVALENRLFGIVDQVRATDTQRERLRVAEQLNDRLARQQQENIALRNRTTKDLQDVRRDLDSIRRSMESSGSTFSRELDTLRRGDEAILRLVAVLGEMVRADERFIHEEYAPRRREPDDD